jgi:hypothetical protein
MRSSARRFQQRRYREQRKNVHSVVAKVCWCKILEFRAMLNVRFRAQSGTLRMTTLRREAANGALRRMTAFGIGGSVLRCPGRVEPVNHRRPKERRVSFRTRSKPASPLPASLGRNTVGPPQVDALGGSKLQMAAMGLRHSGSGGSGLCRPSKSRTESDSFRIRLFGWLCRLKPRGRRVMRSFEFGYTTGAAVRRS